MSEFEKWYAASPLNRADRELQSWTFQAGCNAAREAIKAGGKIYRVKKLEWKATFNGFYVANIGYHVYVASNIFTAIDPTGEIISTLKSLEEAMAACQDDFEHEVLKNLVEVEI